MALYIFTCSKCGTVTKRLINRPSDAAVDMPCPKDGCSGSLHRTPGTPTLHNKRVIRMVHQIKDIETYVDAQQLYDERAHKDYSKPE